MRTMRMVLLTLATLAAFAWAADGVLTRMTRAWFVRDVELRSELAVNGARQALVAHWQAKDTAGLVSVLEEITRDERIQGAAACADDGTTLASTSAYPSEFPCRLIAARLRAERAGASWSTTADLSSGPVHVNVTRLSDGSRALGTVVVVHDLSFAQRRADKTRTLLLAAFGILGGTFTLVTVLGARISWLSWTRELRRILRGHEHKPEYQPLMRDVRDLVQRLTAETDLEHGGGAWTPQRLKETLARNLHGERVVIVANREPYIHEHTDGGIIVRHPASGLVTALEPVMRACSGVWVAHGSGSADRETADAQGRVKVPPGEESYVVRRVWLSAEEGSGYYYGFSNEGLWPLCHLAHSRPLFRREDWDHYRAVNQRFADAVCEEVDADDPIILVQDYHFALAPKLIRERLPRATILTFWHIPWPGAERFGICPFREEIVEGLLGSSIVGFHTQQHCNNFLEAVDTYIESRIDRENNAVVQGGRSTLVRPYPISVEWPIHWLREVPPVPACRAQLRKELGLAPDALLGVGVDRLDYTKGIEERLLAVERLLEQEPALRGKFTFVQLSAPSRTRIRSYRDLASQVEAEAARINDRFAQGTWQPIRLMHTHHEPPEVFRALRAADVCYVSSLHDGMNLVAKEFVAARDDEQGVLVLSHFTGASRDLTEALIVNPYDLDEAAAALAAALRMPKDEQRERMRAMRALVSEFNVYRWAGRMLVDAARLRRKERFNGRLRSTQAGERTRAS
ncbi:MAG: trehalose-6-phosphate synthase [Deltaproteobacteria bacterium]|nr:trehalose-6-phosphate synthase [Deltaproteobacteria bacterium]